jgi:hypothetical protein
VPAEVVRVLITGINLIKVSVLPSLGKLSRPVRQKNFATEKKIQPTSKLFFLNAFGLMQILCLLSGKV